VTRLDLDRSASSDVMWKLFRWLWCCVVEVCMREVVVLGDTFMLERGKTHGLNTLAHPIVIFRNATCRLVHDAHLGHSHAVQCGVLRLRRRRFLSHALDLLDAKFRLLFQHHVRDAIMWPARTHSFILCVPPTNTPCIGFYRRYHSRKTGHNEMSR
jgi:hypothetical protein